MSFYNKEAKKKKEPKPNMVTNPETTEVKKIGK